MWREGDDLEMGMGCGEERWREEGSLRWGGGGEGKERGGVLAPGSQQMDKCSSSSLHFQPPSFSFCVQFCLFDSTPPRVQFALQVNLYRNRATIHAGIYSRALVEASLLARFRSTLVEI